MTAFNLHIMLVPAMKLLLRSLQLVPGSSASVKLITAAAVLGSLIVTSPSVAQDSAAASTPPEPAAASGGGGDADLARQLQNPVASLISVPLQNNWDFGIGPDDGWRYLLNAQPVIPMSISEDWNLINRIIVPYIYQEDVIPGTSSQSGLGDIVQSFFFSPKEPTSGGLIWGAGPVVLWPSATDDLLGSEKWGAGPTFVLLKQAAGWTYGALGNHIWSFAGDDNRSDVNATFIQPFLTFTTAKSTTFGVNSESTYDWENSQWNVPINVFLSQVVRFGSQPVSFTLGGRFYPERPDGGPDWGLRFVVTLLFPK